MNFGVRHTGVQIQPAWLINAGDVFVFYVAETKYKVQMSAPELKSRCQQACVPSGVPRGELVACFFQPLGAACIP